MIHFQLVLMGAGKVGTAWEGECFRNDPPGIQLVPQSGAYTSLQKLCEIKSLPFGMRTCECNTIRE